MPTAQYLLQQIAFDNFMLHRNSQFNLAKSPITLFTGANGSGKTQILDGLLLTLGYHPRRLKKGTASELIGPFADKAEVRSTIHFPEWQRHKPLLPEEIVDFAEDAASTIWEITVTIDSSGLHYALSCAGKTRKLKRRRSIRELFRLLEIKAENKLAFTEEGTVNVFSDHSNKSKLELFLQTTGLADYRANLLESFSALQKAQRATEPLRRKLEIEREYLQSMEKTRHLMEQRQKLEDRYKQLILEEVWAQVQICERNERAIRGTWDNKKKTLDKVEEQCDEVERECTDIDEEMQRQVAERNKWNKRLEQTRSRLRTIEGQTQANRRVLEDTRNREREIEKQLQQALSADSSGKLEPLRRRLAEIAAEIAELDKIVALMGRDFFSPTQEWERNILADALHFRNKAREQGIDVCGPLFLEIELKEPSLQVWRGVAQLLGFHLFSFIIGKRKDFKAAVSLLDEQWPDEWPPFAIVECRPPRDFSPENSEDHSLLRLVRADKRVSYFLEEILAAKLVLPGTGAKSLPQKGSVWHEGKVYREWPAVGGGWCPKILESCPSLSVAELEKAIDSLELRRSFEDEKSALEREYHELDTTSKVRFLEQRLAELTSDAQNFSTEIEELGAEAAELQLKLDDDSEKYAQICDEIEQASERREQLREQSAQLTARCNQLRNEIETLASSLAEKSAELAKQEQIAQQQGNRPAAIRELAEVSKECMLIAGKLETIEISPVSAEIYEQQKQRVERLGSELSGASTHLENLQRDMQRRIASWHEDVGKKTQQISTVMNYLLSTITSEVRLRISNIKEPENAGLAIEVKRHGKKWLDLSHLSGGEKVLTVEALILALHLQTDSPLHAIDECTQRLDLQFKAIALEMVQKAVEKAIEAKQGVYTPQFLLLAPDTLGIEFDNKAEKFFKRYVLAPAMTKVR